MQSSGTWAEQVEAESEFWSSCSTLKLVRFVFASAKPYEPPPREEFVKDGIKTVIEYKYTDGEKLKVS